MVVLRCFYVSPAWEMAAVGSFDYNRIQLRPCCTAKENISKQDIQTFSVAFSLSHICPVSMRLFLLQLMWVSKDGNLVYLCCWAKIGFSFVILKLGHIRNPLLVL